MKQYNVFTKNMLRCKEESIVLSLLHKETKEICTYREDPGAWETRLGRQTFFSLLNILAGLLN